jgi:hypothetical protein
VRWDAGLLTFGNTAPITFSGSGTTALSNIVFGGDLTFTTSNFVDVRRQATLQAGNVTSNGKLRLTSSAASTGLLYNDVQNFPSGGGVVTDNIVVQRYIDPRYNRGSGYRHYSSPVSGATFAMFEAGTDFTAVCNAAYSYPGNNALNPYPTVFYYDESRVPATGTFDYGWLSPASSTGSAGTLQSGRGYTVNIKAANAATGAPNIVNLTGVPLTGDQFGPVTRKTNTGLSLVGNPYPGFIDMNRVMDDNLDNSNHQGFDGMVFKFKSTSMYDGSYTVLSRDDSGTDSLNQYFPMMQGFFVRKTDTVGTAAYQFHDSQRVGESDVPGRGYPTTNTTPFYRTASRAAGTGLYLSVVDQANPALRDESRIEFRQDATPGHDARYDAVRPGDNFGQNPTMFTVNAVGEECMRNGLPELQGSVTVPLGLRTLVPGRTYALQLSKVLQLGVGQAFLEDRQTGRVQDLVAHPTVTFTASASSYEHRFFLRFEHTAGTARALPPTFEVYPNPAATGREVQFSAHGLAPGVATATLLTPFGTTMLTQAIEVSGDGLLMGTLATTGLKPGLYILRFASAASVTTQRLQIR